MDHVGESEMDLPVMSVVKPTDLIKIVITAL